LKRRDLVRRLLARTDGEIAIEVDIGAYERSLPAR